MAPRVPAQRRPPRTAGRDRQHRQVVAAALATLCTLAACGGEDTAPTRGPTTPTEQRPTPREVATAELPAEQIPVAVLRECHGEILGMDSVSTRLLLPDQSQLEVLAHLPDRLRVTHPDGRVELLLGDRCVRLPRGADDAARELDGDAALRLRAIGALVDAMALGPLRRATACERLAPHRFRLTQPDGGSYELVLRPRSLLVEQLIGRGFDVEVADYLHTPASWIPQLATIAPLGECRIRFDAVDFQWVPRLFEVPGEASVEVPGPTDDPATASPGGLSLPEGFRVGEAPRPTTPQVDLARARRWLVVDDPGDWQARADAVQRHLSDLRARGQEQAGFAGIISEGHTERLVIGFRATDDEDDAFVARTGEDVRACAAGRELVVFPAEGSFEQRRAIGEQMLVAALRARGLVARGPILTQPYLHLDEAAPAPDQLAAPVVRVSVAID